VTMTTGVPEEEVKQAMSILPPEAQEIFHRQAIQDQRHGLAVYRSLCRAGHTNPELLAAGLLHDTGKVAARLPSWQRAVIVLLDHFAPRLLERLALQPSPRPSPEGREGDSRPVSVPKGWRRPFVVHAQHPQLGARWAEEAGCSALTVALIRRHHDPLASDSSIISSTTSVTTEENQLLAELQMADNSN